MPYTVAPSFEEPEIKFVNTMFTKPRFGPPVFDEIVVDTLGAGKFLKKTYLLR